MEVEILHTTLTLSVDTGAAVTVITESALDQFNLPIEKTRAGATSASGHGMQCRGEALIPFRILGKSCPHDVLVLADLNCGCAGLLGLDFFTKYRGDVIVTEQKATFPHGSIAVRPVRPQDSNLVNLLKVLVQIGKGNQEFALESELYRPVKAVIACRLGNSDAESQVGTGPKISPTSQVGTGPKVSPTGSVKGKHSCQSDIGNVTKDESESSRRSELPLRDKVPKELNKIEF
jgi:hypothetical protein